MLSRQESWSLANPGIVNALPWQQDFRGVDPSLSCLEPVVFIMPVSIETCWLLIVDLHIAKPSTSCHGSCYPEWIHLNSGAIQFNGYHSHLYLCIFLFFCESLYWATYFCKLSYQITFNCMLLYKITVLIFANCCTKQFFCNYHTIAFFQCVTAVLSSVKVK